MINKRASVGRISEASYTFKIFNIPGDIAFCAGYRRKLKNFQLARSRVHKRSVMHQSIEITKVYDAWLIHPTLAVP